MRIIATSPAAVRIVCEACGSHRVVDRRLLAPAIRCFTCDVTRPLLDRRLRDRGHRPERRALLPSV